MFFSSKVQRKDESNVRVNVRVSQSQVKSGLQEKA